MLDIRAWLQGLADAQATVPASVVLDRLSAGDMPQAPAVAELVADPSPPTWRVQLWSVPSEVRLGVREVAEALGRSTSWVYKRTQRSAESPIPHRRLDGALVFSAGEIRHWVRQQERDGVEGPMDAARRAS